LELARYETKAGETRGLYGIRVNGRPRIIDAAAEGRGRTYTVEEDVRDGYEEVKGIVAAYIEQAEQLGQIPMASSSPTY
jgi:predicted RecB family endonuclease